MKLLFSDIYLLLVNEYKPHSIIIYLYVFIDHVFGEHDTTDDLYYYSVQPLIEFVIGGGRATVFAYGQTGSGKTYTMMGVQRFVADDLFYGLAAAAEEAEATNSVIKSIEVYVTFFEIYGGRCQDLLNERNKLVIREDGNGEVNIAELLEVKVDSAEEMLRVIESGNTNRTTHATESNEVSSRSHAICQILLRKVDAKGRSKMLGKLSLIDLAGSERGADTKSHNRTRRMEGAEINKSLLALKECVRALDSNSSHVPYRASKLTLVLKDSFTKNQSRTVMIVNVSPAASSADHTLNTLRYADRIKETQVGDRKEKIYEEASVPPAPHSRESRDRSASPKVAAPNVNNKLNLQPPLRSAAAANARAGIAGMNIGKSPPVPNSNNQVTPPSVPNRPYEEDDGYMDNEEAFEFGETADEKELNKTIQSLFDEEEELLNLHMNNIQENAELLTEEGKLLQQLQGSVYFCMLILYVHG